MGRWEPGLVEGRGVNVSWGQSVSLGRRKVPEMTEGMGVQLGECVLFPLSCAPKMVKVGKNKCECEERGRTSTPPPGSLGGLVRTQSLPPTENALILLGCGLLTLRLWEGPC